LIYLNNKINSVNYPITQSFVSQPMTSFNNNGVIETDSVSFSSNSSNNDKPKKKSSNLIAYLVGGLTLAAGIVFTVIKIKKGRGSKNVVDIGNDIIKGAKNEESKVINNIEKNISTAEKQDASISELDSQIAEANKRVVEQEAKKVDLQQKLDISENSTIPSGDSQHKPTNKNKSREITEIKVEKETPIAPQPEKSKVADKVNSSTIDEQANQAYNQYAQKLAKDLKLEGKEALIREVLPDLMILKNNDVALKEALEHITIQNKDFVTKTAVPTILRNAEVLDLEKAMGKTLKAISPDTVDCLDKLAANAQRFKIKSNTDTQLLLEAISKENKDFVFAEVLPHLVDNAEKYQISRGGYMAGFIDAITPQNRDFMFNEAIPVIINNMDKLGIDISEVAQVAELTTKTNLKTIQNIANNMDKFDIKDELNFLDIDKLSNYITK